ncbi:H-NS histone family protein [Bradyrhizobium sp. Arg62]|uniref:H-NS family nucleoid-associated regulatory protein n=1 Tax=Bradyrhizobium brasilense TaxID=1419277 RepID=UPI001E4441E7|nr:H-NS histone family protein [Bradyrhizobium brasilense]
METELRRFDALERKAAGGIKIRAKAAAKYRSKKDKALTWSGRGSTPRWLREEMKAMKLKQDSFLIVRRTG